MPDKSQPTRSLISQIGAHESWAATKDRTARTEPGRRALEERFLAEADGDPQRAAHLRKAHFQRLALKSVQARRRQREAREAAEAAEAEMEAAGTDLDTAMQGGGVA